MTPGYKLEDIFMQPILFIWNYIVAKKLTLYRSSIWVPWIISLNLFNLKTLIFLKLQTFSSRNISVMVESEPIWQKRLLLDFI